MNRDQISYITLIGVHSTMYLVHPNYYKCRVTTIYIYVDNTMEVHLALPGLSLTYPLAVPLLQDLSAQSAQSGGLGGHISSLVKFVLLGQCLRLK